MKTIDVMAYICAAIFLFSLILNTGFGEKQIFKVKTANMTIEKGEMAVCYFGNEKVGNPVCNYYDMNGKPYKQYNNLIQAYAGDKYAKIDFLDEETKKSLKELNKLNATVQEFVNNYGR